MDLSSFAGTFFEEANEHLDSMEQLLLQVDISNPDAEELNAIFRAAHSIKGGAATFGFELLQRTTHIFENLLDNLRRGEINLRKDIVDTFLQTKDVLKIQLDAYRNDTVPDEDEFKATCKLLEDMTAAELGVTKRIETPAVAKTPETTSILKISFLKTKEEDRVSLVQELGHLGSIVDQKGDHDCYEVIVDTSATKEEIECVLCFVTEPELLRIEDANAHTSSTPTENQVIKSEPPKKSQKPAPATSESNTLRVPVEKVDQIINLVGELVITQSMLDQSLGQIEGQHPDLMNGMSLLQRNARDLQEAVMSIRMVQMDFVFSRFPRQIRDLAGKLNKEVELITEGKSTELDKSLVEKIVDPLSHLVRNSLDHGIESPEVRVAAGKPRVGKLTLSAKHQGGNILIEVIDDGAGLNRDKLLSKAKSNGLAVSETMSDEDVWQLIFAPGFSTAEVVTDVSGRGVGMDVVKRNIQQLGGHVKILSTAGRGTKTQIVLPLTMAILDGMSVRCGSEIFILPLGSVIESLQPSLSDVYTMAGNDKLLKVREDYLPIVGLGETFQIEDRTLDIEKSIAVIVQAEGKSYALVVDSLVGQQQVVVKNLETNYRKVPGVSAATILGDGSVSLILDVAALLHLSKTNQIHTKTTTAEDLEKNDG